MPSVYLDAAATSYPKPPEVADAVCSFITKAGSNINRGGYESAYETADKVYECRERLSRFFNGDDPKNVIFTLNVTMSLNIVLKGLLRPGDHVLVSSMEHNAVMRPLRQLHKKGVEFTRIPTDEYGVMNLSLLPDLLQENTRLLVCSHASNVTGLIAPIDQIGDFCHTHGILFVLDSAQSAGVLDIDMQAQHIDALCFTGHKGLMGPQGTGGFILREGLAAQIDPLLSGGTGSLSHTEEIPEFMPDRFEAGTLNLPGIMGLNEGVKWVERTGLKEIYRREETLSRRFLAGIAEIPEVNVIGREADPLKHSAAASYTAVLSLQISGWDLGEFAYRLDAEYGIATRVGLHCSPIAHKTLGTYPEGTLRFSIGYFNTEDDIDYAVQAIRSICESGRA